MNKKKPIDILQGKFKYFTGDVELDDENEDKNNTNPFRIKKVGDKYEYDFVSYSDWEKLMEKYDYEGDLDGFNPTEYEDLDKYVAKIEKRFKKDGKLKKRNGMIKMKELLTLKENVDTDIKKNIDALGKLTEDINRVKNEILKPMEDKYKDITSTTLPILEKLGKETLTTKKYVFRILKKKHYRSSVSYRELFNTALGKVNKRTAGLLTSIKQELTKISLIQPKFSIQPIESIGDNVKKLVKVLKQKITKLIPKLKSVMSANKDLRKLI